VSVAFIYVDAPSADVANDNVSVFVGLPGDHTPPEYRHAVLLSTVFSWGRNARKSWLEKQGIFIMDELAKPDLKHEQSSAPSASQHRHENAVAGPSTSSHRTSKRMRRSASQDSLSEDANRPEQPSDSTFQISQAQMGEQFYLRLVIGGLAKLFSAPLNVGIQLSLDRDGNRGPHGEPGSGAYSSIKGYQRVAKALRWHATDRIKELFDILLERVESHQTELILTHQHTIYVPLLEDINTNRLLFKTLENGNIELFRLTTSLPDRQNRQDILHRVARLAFLTHLLEQPMWFRRDGKIELFDVEDLTRLKHVATNRERLESDILNHYFLELHRLAPDLRASPKPSYKERLRFWRYVDIEYCDYVAYFASLPKKNDGDKERDFLNATLLVRVLIDNEAWFRDELGQTFGEELSVGNCGYCRISVVTDAILTVAQTRTFARLLLTGSRKTWPN
jgi:hypothetical protein